MQRPPPRVRGGREGRWRWPSAAGVVAPDLGSRGGVPGAALERPVVGDGRFVALAGGLSADEVPEASSFCCGAAGGRIEFALEAHDLVIDPLEFVLGRSVDLRRELAALERRLDGLAGLRLDISQALHVCEGGAIEREHPSVLVRLRTESLPRIGCLLLFAPGALVVGDDGLAGGLGFGLLAHERLALGLELLQVGLLGGLDLGLVGRGGLLDGVELDRVLGQGGGGAGEQGDGQEHGDHGVSGGLGVVGRPHCSTADRGQ